MTHYYRKSAVLKLGMPQPLTDDKPSVLLAAHIITTLLFTQRFTQWRPNPLAKSSNNEVEETQKPIMSFFFIQSQAVCFVCAKIRTRWRDFGQTSDVFSPNIKPQDEDEVYLLYRKPNFIIIIWWREKSIFLVYFPQFRFRKNFMYTQRSWRRCDSVFYAFAVYPFRIFIFQQTI